jgi:hypothetical protein
MGEMRNSYKILIGKPERNKPLGRSKRRWEYNIAMDLRETLWEIENWMHLGHDKDQ